MKVMTCGKNATRKNCQESVKNVPEDKNVRRKARREWLGHGENDLKKMGVRGWRKMAGNRDAWKLILKETRVLYGRYRQWNRRSMNFLSTANLMSKGKY